MNTSVNPVEYRQWRQVVTHHDGFGASERIHIYADPPGPGGASHRYIIEVDQEGSSPTVVADIQYACGPRHEATSVPGVFDSVLLAVVADRMESFNKGLLPTRENSLVLTKVQEAMHWLFHRAHERARRGVLGRLAP
jgi:hypothetical protein